MSKSKNGLILVGVLLVAVVSVAIVVRSRSSDQEKITITRTGGPVVLSELNRSDELGADTVRGYLRGAMDCSSQGADVGRKLSGAGNEPVQALVDAACAAGRETWPSEVTSEVTQAELDGQQRARWRIAAGQALPDGLVVYVKQVDGNWTLAGRCLRGCDTTGGV